MTFKVHDRKPKRVWRRHWTTYGSLIEAVKVGQQIIRDHGGPENREARVIVHDPTHRTLTGKELVAWYSKENT